MAETRKPERKVFTRNEWDPSGLTLIDTTGNGVYWT